MAKPLHFSKIPAKARPLGPSLGELGAGALGFTVIRPVQREIWLLHEARTALGLPLFDNLAVEVTRRAGKTEGLLSLGVGRCSSIEDYQIVYAAQSGTKSRERFYGMLRRLRRHSPGGWRARESRGEERIEWDNGAIFRFAPPIADYFRGDGVDWAILDESQEVDPEDSADLIGSLLPIFDGMVGPQLTAAGTAGEVREGLLWEALENGRAGRWGILEYAAPEGADIEDERVWVKTHPGPARGGDVLELLRKRRAAMSAEMFAREYLGVWPLTSAHAAIDAEVWQRLGRALVEPQPRRFGLAFDVTPGGGRTAVMAAWRNSAGEAWVEVVREDHGTKWAVDFIGTLARKHRLPVGHDTAGTDTLALADDIARRHPAVKLQGLTTQEFATACAVIDKAIREGDLRHSRQQALNEATEVASRRTFKDGGWMWGRVASSGSIHALVGATVALRVFDDLPAARSMKIITAAKTA